MWAPIAEGVINITLAAILGVRYGVSGILAGTYISLFLIIRLWKPYLLFTKGFERSPWDYWRGNIKFLVITLALIVASQVGLQQLGLEMKASYLTLFTHMAWITPIFALALFTAFYLTSEGFRKVTKRLWLLVEPKALAMRRLVLRR